MKAFFILVSLVFSAPAQAEEMPKVIEAYSSFDTPGYNEFDASGKPTGYEIELADAIFASQGYALTWKMRGWDEIVADLSNSSTDKNYFYIASIEARPDRRTNWLFGMASEYEASHYFFGRANLNLKTGSITDTKTGNSVPNFLLDTPENRVNGRKLKIATWKGSSFEEELHRAFPNAAHIEIVAVEDGSSPTDWLKDGRADVVYAFASGPKNSYTALGYRIAGGPITNFDLDRFSGTSPAFPANAFGQNLSRVWLDGFAAILRDDTFFKISMKYFGRVSWPRDLNDFLLIDPKEFQKRIERFENGLK